MLKPGPQGLESIVRSPLTSQCNKEIAPKGRAALGLPVHAAPPAQRQHTASQPSRRTPGTAPTEPTPRRRGKPAMPAPLICLNVNWEQREENLCLRHKVVRLTDRKVTASVRHEGSKARSRSSAASPASRRDPPHRRPRADPCEQSPREGPSGRGAEGGRVPS